MLTLCPLLIVLVILDLKGTQYTGKIFPGPTALVLVVTNSTNGAADPYLKVEGITDEFCSLVKTGDAMAKMNAAVQDAMEDYYNYEDEDVNRTTKTDSAAADTAEGSKADPKKRRRPSKAAAPKRKR